MFDVFLFFVIMYVQYLKYLPSFGIFLSAVEFIIPRHKHTFSDSIVIGKIHPKNMCVADFNSMLYVVSRDLGINMIFKV